LTRRAPRGWTLVELTITLAVAAIVIALAAPRSFDRNAFAVRGYAADLASAARLARTVAVASGCRVQLTIDNNGYRARRGTSLGSHCNAGGGFPNALQRSDGQSVQAIAPQGLPFVGTNRWTFNNDGSVSVSGASTLSFGSQTLRVDTASGAVFGP
jgi:prepilin-type N-terminal cleavage/methylation domain-containing protein